MPSDAAIPGEAIAFDALAPEPATSPQPAVPPPEEPKESIQPFAVRKPSLLTASELRRLGLRHDDFARLLATRLSIHLRLEIGVKVLSLDSCFYPQFLERLANPSQIALFSVEGLDGVGLLDVPPQLGIALVDRLLGGAGKTMTLDRDLTEIETALLDQIVDLVLKEWCQVVASMPAAKPGILGHETNPRFLQTASSDTSLFIATIELHLNEFAEKVHFALPYPMLQPVIRKLNPPLESRKQAPLTSSASLKWNRSLDSVAVPLSVEWDGLEIDARKLAELNVGDVLPLAAERIENAAVRLGSVLKFKGRLGKCGRAWAVELIEKI